MKNSEPFSIQEDSIKLKLIILGLIIASTGPIIVGLILVITGPFIFNMAINQTGKLNNYIIFYGVLGIPFGVGMIIYALFFYKQLTFIFLEDGIKVVTTKGDKVIDFFSTEELNVVNKIFYTIVEKNEKTLETIEYTFVNRNLTIPGYSKERDQLAQTVDRVLINLYKSKIAVDESTEVVKK